MNSEQITVAIDGPSASGKSTVSREVARALGFVYVDSGSLYRGITWKALQEGVSCRDRDAVLAMVAQMRIEFFLDERVVRFRIDDVDPGQDIRAQGVVNNVSDVAAIPEVRQFINRHLRGMSAFGPLVMEGRDIGSVVFPDSPHKYYLDADPEERARRRHRELVGVSEAGGVDDVLDSLRRRDHKDTTRQTAPLQIALGAKVINTTSLSIEEVSKQIASEIRALERPA